MKKSRILVSLVSLSAMFFLAAPKGYAQVFSVQPVNGMTAQQLVEDMLVGDGVLITNAKFNRSTGSINTDCIGKFFNLNLYAPNDRLDRAAVNWQSGIIMTTGSITKATSTNTSVCANASNVTVNGYECFSPYAPGTLPIDPNLPGNGTANASNINSLTMLEFDFEANSSSISFEYIFASSEYPQFVSTSYNDVFAFHISGGIDPTMPSTTMTPRNIALIPNSITAVAINTVNNGNSSSNGSATQEGSPLTTSNSQYFFDNRSNQYTSNIRYGGFTVELTARTVIWPCSDPYHMSLSIADVSDNGYHSAVFLKKGSFRAPQLDIKDSYEIGGNDTIMTGCNACFLDLSLPESNLSLVNGNVRGLGLSGGATALWGTHYEVRNLNNNNAIIASGAAVTFGTGVVDEVNGQYVLRADNPEDTLIRLEIRAIPGSIPFGETRIAQIVTRLKAQGYSSLCDKETLDTLTLILKGYELLEFDADTVFNCCDKFTGEIGTIVKTGYLQSVTWGGPTQNLTIDNTNSLRATVTTPLTDTTIFTIYGVDSYGCAKDTAHIQINISKRPTATIQSNVMTGCTPFKFSPSSATTPNDASLQWIASEGQTATIKNPTFTINRDTVVWLYAYAADYCYDSTYVSVKVYERPHAEFNYLPFEPLNGRPIEFYNTSTGDISDYRWNFGDGTTSSEINPTHTYHVNNSEIFNVLLITTAGAIENCADTTLQQVAVEDRYAYYIPTAFTPNGDGVNDEFTPMLTDAFDYTFAVYNRWGSLVFFTNEIGNGWDGKDKKGNDCDAGVYVWKINFKKYSDPNALLEYKGMVTLVR